MTFGGFWIFDDREVQIETYSAAVRITQPREIALYAKVFEHYPRRAVYGQQAADLISEAIGDRAWDFSQATYGNLLITVGYFCNAESNRTAGLATCNRNDKALSLSRLARQPAMGPTGL
jgi:hypothetical protein